MKKYPGKLPSLVDRFMFGCGQSFGGGSGDFCLFVLVEWGTARHFMDRPVTCHDQRHLVDLAGARVEDEHWDPWSPTICEIESDLLTVNVGFSRTLLFQYGHSAAIDPQTMATECTVR